MALNLEGQRSWRQREAHGTSHGNVPGLGQESPAKQHQNAVPKPISSYRPAMVWKGSAAPAEPSSPSRLDRTCMEMQPGRGSGERGGSARKEIWVKLPSVPFALFCFGFFSLCKPSSALGWKGKSYSRSAFVPC